MQSALPPLPLRSLRLNGLLYFFQFCGIGVFYTYLNVYFRTVGLSGVEIGVLNMVGALVSVVSSTLWGYLADTTGRPRIFILAGALGAGLVAQGIQTAHSFSDFLILMGLLNFFASAPIPLLDNLTLTLLGERREEYGKYRLGGTLGYIVSTPVIGFLFEKYTLGLMFPAFLAVSVCFALLAFFLPVKIARKVVPHSPEGQPPAQTPALSLMITRPAWIIFTVCTFLVWFATSGGINFLAISMQSMGASNSLIGIASAAASVFEIPFMLYSGRWIKRFGVTRVFWVSMLAATLRYFLYAVMPSPYWVIGINALNGPHFTFFWNSGINYAYQMAPAALTATAQGLFTSTTNLATVVTSLVSGWMFDRFGPPGLFFTLSAACLLAFVIFGLSTIRKEWRLKG